ncbi:hypothetical protein [Kutzneria buriramensis]|uniref:Uncharacterized protein n=1 Tax=Kutzneria buriramensis TaxID=1045776 RepID=A0A3E0HCR1_9PSEU|nr:hypothetical protein [Kutzneria buriramensis]REH42576.1 hypothetical protein BCF44_11072 [Kutzneria buriramensis]
MSWLRRRLTGLPEGFAGQLAANESVAASCTSGGEPVVATSLGLWLPGEERLGWHLVSKATWDGNALTVVAAATSGTAGTAVLLTDQPPRRYPLENPGKLPEAVQRRVTGSIVDRHRHELPGGGVWFIKRRVPGQDGTILQVRADAGVDPAAVAKLAAQVSARLH